jgi:hypothetical protein
MSLPQLGTKRVGGGEAWSSSRPTSWLLASVVLFSPQSSAEVPSICGSSTDPNARGRNNLERLRERGLSTKRSMALREFALGIESLERFVRREPLRRVHECVFGVLALESEPVDPRLQREVRCRKASSTFFRVLEGTVQYRNMNRAFEIARIWSISKSVSYFRSAVF